MPSARTDRVLTVEARPARKALRATLARPLATATVQALLLVALIAIVVGWATRDTPPHHAQTAGVGALVDSPGQRALKLAGTSAWVSALQGELFDPAKVWRPGDRRTATVFVRNQSAGPEDLALEVDRATNEDATGGYLSLAVRVGPGTWSPFDLADTTQEVPLGRVRARGVAALRLRATVSDRAPHTLDVPAVDLDFTVSVLQPAPPPQPTSAAPSTNAHLVLAPIFLLLAGLGVIGLLLVGRRGQDHDEGDPAGPRRMRVHDLSP